MSSNKDEKSTLVRLGYEPLAHMTLLLDYLILKLKHRINYLKCWPTGSRRQRVGLESGQIAENVSKRHSSQGKPKQKL